MDVLQFTAAISEGSSGGALFDDNGNVIGVTYASYIDGQSLNFAVPAELVKALYDTKGPTYKANAIYLNEYPYAEYLKEYEDIPQITINELKTSPRKYSGKTVKIAAYISSDTKLRICNISGKNDVSGDWNEDHRLAVNNDFEKIPQVRVVGSEGKYWEKDLLPGDYVVVIGKFEYQPKGTIEKIDDEQITLTNNEGRLTEGIVFKIQ